MGSLNDQFNKKSKMDEESFEEALRNMANAVSGHSFERSYHNDFSRFQDAVEKSLSQLHVFTSKSPVPDEDIYDYLNNVLLQSGIMYRTVKLDKDWYLFAYNPMLGTLKDSKKVVSIIKNRYKGYSYIDPDTGKKIKITRKNSSVFEEEAIIFYRPFPQKKLSGKDLTVFMVRSLNIWDLASVLLAFLMVTLLGMILPNLNNQLFSQVPESRSTNLLIGISIFMISVSISMMLFNIIKRIVLMRLQTKIGIAVKSAVFLRIISLPAPFFRDYSSGELFSYANAIQSLCDKLVDTVFSTGLTALLSLAYISSIFVFAPALVIPSIIIIGVSVLFMVISSVQKQKQMEKQMKAGAKTRGESFSIIAGIRKIRLTGSEKRAFARWGNSYAVQSGLKYNPKFFLAINPAVNVFITLLGTIVLYFIAMKTNVSPANYQSFTVSYGMVSGAFSTLAQAVLTTAEIRPMLKLAKPLMDTVPEVTEEKEQVTGIYNEIELSHITFSYAADQPPVLNDLSLKIKAGEYTAIVGRTGCGKSTIVRLLMGFEKAEKGTVYYDHRDIASLNVTSLRRHLGVVTQNGKLFQGSICSNILISAPQLTINDAWEAAETAGIADDIREMPMGMFTMVSEGTGGISGGQKQRLMIARAIAHKPDVLIFDEATSALDNVTQEKVTQALDELHCTRIVIAHRLSTIQRCDRILVLEEGHITEEGTYEELMKKNGFFAALVKRQQI